MILTKVEVKGEEKASAVIELQKGLNVISGASNTGKSYICQCIQFILGAENPPKNIKESKGYTSLEVTFKQDDGSSFILKRELKANADIVLIESEVTKILKPTHKGKNNLSSFFLEKAGVGNKILVTGVESFNHSTLTLRIFEKLFIVDEKRIITDDSPLGTGQNTEKTLERSLLKTLLTGNDDSVVLGLKKNKESKQSLKTKIANLEDFLRKYFPDKRSDVNENKIQQLSLDIARLEDSIEKAEQELDSLLREGSEGIEQRNRLASISENLSRKLDEDNTVLERFRLLLSKYSSDRERLEASSEAGKYVNSHYVANCPTCGSNLDNASNISLELILASNKSEIKKIDAKVEGLYSTIKDIDDHKLLITTELASVVEKLNELESRYDPNVSYAIKNCRSLIRSLLINKESLSLELSAEIKRSEILKEVGTLQTKHDGLTDKFEMPEFASELDELMKEISAVLVRWDFPDGNLITYDEDKRDISVGEKPRGHLGKGYRAICLSAFIIGMMNYLSSVGRHPGFIVLDSPLTSYKQRDEVEVPIEEEDEQSFIENNLIYAFYRDLCDFYNDKQIIVLDNQEPATDLTDKMKYIHFSGNESIGRYGFFLPVK